jgi:hypothetical protein
MHGVAGMHVRMHAKVGPVPEACHACHCIALPLMSQHHNNPFLEAEGPLWP